MLKNKTIGDKIAEARKKTTISQAQLADRLFISPQAVGKWERGESMPDITTFNRLAEILGVDLNYFSENFQSTSVEPAVAAAAINSTSEAPIKKEWKKLSWDMSRENLVDADFSGLKNLHEKFSGSNLLRCLFVGSDMSGLLLESNNVDSCDFSNSNISASKIHSTNLSNNLFNNCSLKETEFSKSFVDSCNFTNADLTGVQFKSGIFGNNTVVNAKWNNAVFNAAYISDVVFEGKLEDCFFEICTFNKVVFQNSTLINTFFKHNKKLKKIQFVNCKADKITYAFLKTGGADLSGIDLMGE